MKKLQSKEAKIEPVQITRGKKKTFRINELKY